MNLIKSYPKLILYLVLLIEDGDRGPHLNMVAALIWTYIVSRNSRPALSPLSALPMSGLKATGLASGLLSLSQG